MQKIGRYGLQSSPLILALLLIYLTSHYNYLLFHSLAEGFSIVIAFSIFMIAWNARRLFRNNYLIFIGIAYLYVGGLDFLHTLAYKGMGVFEGFGANLPTQLWIASRYLQAFSLLAAPFFIRRRLFDRSTFVAYGLVTGLLLASIFYWKIFPDCYIEGTGLTSFKIYSEYVICLIFLAAIGFLLLKKKDFDLKVLTLLIASIAVTIAQELAFTTYLSVYGPSNMIGHFLKIISFYLIYKAIIETSLVTPWNLLYRDLKQSEAQLNQARRAAEKSAAELEIRVQERTAALVLTNDALIESERNFRLIAETVQDIFWMYTPGSQEVDYVSPAYKRISGRSLENKSLNPMNIMDIIHPEDRHRVLTAMESRFRGEYYDLEFRIIGSNGMVRWIIDRTYPVYDDSGNVERMVGVATDITDRKEGEERLRKYAQELEQANRDLADFSYIASHDLQEPLRLLVTLSDRLATLHVEYLDQRGKYFLERIGILAKRAGKLIHDIHKYSTVVSRQEPFQPTDLNMAVREALSDFEEQIEQKNALIEIGRLITLEADTSQMVDVFKNLLSNALKFAGEEKPRISISGETVDNGHRYRITITDNGVGFDEIYRDKILTPFQRLHSRDEYEGSGIGLALCRKILERHGGSITARSNPGQGSTFILTLPLKTE